MANDPLKSAFAAFREETAGHSERAEATLERLLTGAEARAVRRLPRAVRWIPLAAALAASSAWAALGNEGTSRVIAQWTEGPTLPAARPSLKRMAPVAPPADTSVEAAAPEAPEPIAPPVSEPAPVGSAKPVASPLPPEASARTRPQPSSAPQPSAAPADAPSAAAIAPAAPVVSAAAAGSEALAADTRDFKAAYRMHNASDATQSVRAWDAYLAGHPNGRFVPEARYARAMALVRAGRRAEARAALQPFAAAPTGSYRQADAARVLQALE